MTMATVSASCPTAAEIKSAHESKLRLFSFEVREQLARGHARHFRRRRFTQRREQRFDCRLEFAKSREYAVVLCNAKLRCIRSCFGPTGVTGGARDSSQHVEQ